jgi:hypothetical protein
MSAVLLVVIVVGFMGVLILVLFDLGYLLGRSMLQANGQTTDGSAYAAGNASTVTALWRRVEKALGSLRIKGGTREEGGAIGQRRSRFEGELGDGFSIASVFVRDPNTSV